MTMKLFLHNKCWQCTIVLTIIIDVSRILIDVYLVIGVSTEMVLHKWFDYETWSKTVNRLFWQSRKKLEICAETTGL